jgi:hypothetical protein
MTRCQAPRSPLTQSAKSPRRHGEGPRCLLLLRLALYARPLLAYQPPAAMVTTTAATPARTAYGGDDEPPADSATSGASAMPPTGAGPTVEVLVGVPIGVLAQCHIPLCVLAAIRYPESRKTPCSPSLAAVLTPRMIHRLIPSWPAGKGGVQRGMLPLCRACPPEAGVSPDSLKHF